MNKAQERFRKALLRGMKASPFRTEAVFVINGQAVPVDHCQVESGEDDPTVQDHDLTKVRRLTLMVLKTALPERPDHDRDTLSCLGREWQMVSVEGDDPVSPVWSIKCASPI